MGKQNLLKTRPVLKWRKWEGIGENAQEEVDKRKERETKNFQQYHLFGTVVKVDMLKGAPGGVGAVVKEDKTNW